MTDVPRKEVEIKNKEITLLHTRNEVINIFKCDRGAYFV